MALLDVDKLLTPISEAEPCGPNLEYDAGFTEMERAAQGVPEQQYGDTIIQAKEPDWISVKRASLELLGRSKDLRIALHLARATLRVGGLAEFCEVLGLVDGFVERFWPTFHPQLDPEDDNDPTIRVNCLSALCDNASIIAPLRLTPLVRSRAIGSFNRRDIAIAYGEVAKPERRESDSEDGGDSKEGEKVPDRQMIDGAFHSCDQAELTRFIEATVAGAQAIRNVENFVTREIGAGQMRSLSALTKELDGIHKILADQAKRVIVPAESPEAAAESPEASAESTESSGAASGETGSAKRGGLVQNWNAEIQNRDDAIRILEKVCQYYEKNEPSSPLPLLLRRAMRLSSKSFLDILFDVSPDGLGQAEALGGMTREEYLQYKADRGE